MYFLSKHSTEAAYNLIKSRLHKPHVAFIEELAQIANYVRYLKDEEEIVHDYSREYFTIEPLENGEISFNSEGLLYSIDKETWTSWDGSALSIIQGQNVYLKGNLNPSPSIYSGIGTLYVIGNINVSGNIMSLIFGDNFIGQTSLAGKDYAFSYLFEGHSYDDYENPYLINAENLILPATTLSTACYLSMFRGCTSLLTPPELPATLMAPSCYDGMFCDCESLSTAPELPATTLAVRCYHYMFYNCYALTTAPELPATTLAESCYMYMFDGCTGLTTPPELPATTLTEACYYWMFSSCSSLTTAPELPATTLTANCYGSMFFYCTSLTTAPELPAKVLTNYCYNQMFYGCSSLNYIKCLATDISAINCTKDWVQNVDTSGTFIKDSSMNDWTIGNNGIPTNWTIINANATRLAWTSNTCNVTLGSGTHTYPTLSNPNNLSVTYSSSNTSIATIDSSGNITLTNTIGSTTISASFAGDSNYDPDIVTYTLTVSKADANISWSANSITITEGISYTLPTFSNPNNLTVTFSSSDTSVATIDSSGNISLVALGNTVISATFAGDSNYNSSTVSYQLIYQEYQKENPTLQWSASTYSLYINETYNGPTLSVTSGLTITYSSSDTNVATIDNSGNVTILSEGTATITASFAGNQYYNSASDSYTLTVSKVNANIAWSANTFNSTIVNPSYPVFSNPNNLTIAFSSSDSNIATIDSSGNITYVGEGTCTLTATFTGNNIYNSSTVTCQLTLVNRNYAQDYLTFTALESTTFSFTNKGTGDNLEYSLDNGTTWNELESGNSTSTIATGDSVIWRGTREAHIGSSSQGIGTFSATGNFDISGNILSLVYGDDFNTYLNSNNGIQRNYAFYKLFDSCTKIININNIIMPNNTTQHCYEKMFQSCTHILNSPILPATTLSSDCYAEMFNGCTRLETAPALPATTLTNNCYYRMFKSCTALTTAPVLSATTLANYCYNQMFYGCSLINSIVCLATNITGFQYPLTEWVKNVANSGIFYKASTMYDWTTGNDGVPTGWTLLNYGQPPLLWNNGSYTCDILNASPSYPTLTNPENLTITYSSSDQTVATINSSGQITIIGIGSTTISAIFAGNNDYDPITVTYTLTITKANPNIAWSTNSTSVLLNDTFTAPTLSNPNNLTVTYTSSDTSVATINSSTGAITILDEGTTTISAIFAGNSNYNSSTVTYTLEVLAAGVILDWGTDATNEYTPYTGRSYITDVSNLTSSKMTLNYVDPNGNSGSFESSFLRTSSSYGNPNQGISGFKTWIEHYGPADKSDCWDDISSSNFSILSTWENTSGVQVAYGWMGDLSTSGQNWSDKWTTKKIASFKNCNLLGVIVMDGNFIEKSQYCNVSVKAWNGSEMTVDGRPCVSFDPNTTVGAKGILIAIVYTES